jgi:selenocysteine lyase/cysteine desulfurase
MDDAARRTFVVDEPAGDVTAAASSAPAGPTPASASSAGLIRVLRRSVVGECDAVPTPLGPRKATYLDHTATGRALGFIERYVATQVLPLYANTHTTTSYSGFAAHSFLSEARGIVREALNASDRFDCVLFTGRGATAASNVLAHYLARPVPAVTGGSQEASSDAAAASVTLFECPFPGCGRRYGSQADARLHARTHPDGEQAAHGIRAVTVAAGAPAAAAGAGGAASSAASSAVPDAAAAAAAVQPVHVVVGPWAHHSSLLPWVEAGRHVRLHLLPQDGGCGSEDGGAATDALAFYRSLLRHLHDTLVRIKRDTAASASLPLPPRVVLVFTAASNVTGAMLPEAVVDAVCALAHAHGAVSLWDYAASAPHAGPVDVNPRTSLTLAQALSVVGDAGVGASPAAAATATALDGVDWGGLSPNAPAHPTTRGAVYFSSHKLTGGPGGPGILVLKRSLMATAAAASSSSGDGGSHGIVPAAPGGGTVFFVHPDGSPRYLANDEEREEAGSPDTLGAVRGALALHTLKSGVGWAAVGAREAAMAAVARATWAAHPNIRIVGDGPGPRTPVVSFVLAAAPVPSPSGGSGGSSSPPPRLLHHWGFVAAVLNDVFGIQARGGCLCAGPYVQSLLGWDDAASAAELEAALLGKDELLRPGVVRVSFPFYMGHAAFRHVVRAVAWVASHASELLSLYQPVAESGEWRMHRAAAGAAVEAGYAALPPADLAVAVAPGLSLSPRQVIAAATSAAGAAGAPAVVLSSSHVTAAQKGGWKQHPRRWLQEVRFTGDGGGSGAPAGVSWPSHRVTVDVREDAAAAAAEAAPADGSAAAVAKSPPPSSPVPESALYRAYEAEARLLVAGLAQQRQQQLSAAASGGASSASAAAGPLPSPAAAAVLQHHSPAALLSPRGQPLRWFALAGDVVAGHAAAAAATGSVDWVARVRRWTPPAEAAAGPMDAGAAAALGGVWSAPPAEFTALLSTDAPSVAHLVAWDGPPADGSDDGGSEDDDAAVADTVGPRKAAAAPPPVAAAGGRNKRRGGGAAAGSSSAAGSASAPPAKRPALAPPSPVVAAAAGDADDVRMGDDATSESGSTAASSSSSAAAATAAAPALPGVRSGGGTLRQDLRRDPARAARVKATLAAIARLPPPPAPLSRALSKALGKGIKEFDMIREGDRLLVGLSGGKDSLSLLILLAGLQARAPVAFELAAATVDPQ